MDIDNTDLTVGTTQIKSSLSPSDLLNDPVIRNSTAPAASNDDAEEQNQGQTQNPPPNNTNQTSNPPPPPSSNNSPPPPRQQPTTTRDLTFLIDHVILGHNGNPHYIILSAPLVVEGFDISFLTIQSNDPLLQGGNQVIIRDVELGPGRAEVDAYIEEISIKNYFRTIELVSTTPPPGGGNRTPNNPPPPPSFPDVVKKNHDLIDEENSFFKLRDELKAIINQNKSVVQEAQTLGLTLPSFSDNALDFFQTAPFVLFDAGQPLNSPFNQQTSDKNDKIRQKKNDNGIDDKTKNFISNLPLPSAKNVAKSKILELFKKHRPDLENSADVVVFLEKMEQAMVQQQSQKQQSSKNPSARNNIRELLIDNISQQERNERDNELGLRSRTANEYYLTTPLTGELNLSTFPHLKKLKVEHQSLTRLVLADCHSLKSLEANDNLLREVVFPTQTQALESVYLTNNDLSARNLYCFSHFPNLRVLFLGTDDKDRIRQDINATDINDGLNYLVTKNLSYFTFGSQEEWAADDDFDNNLYKIGHIHNNVLDLKKLFTDFPGLVRGLESRGVSEEQLTILRERYKEEKEIIHTLNKLRQQRNQLEGPNNAEKVREVREEIA
ncbi:8745_t:CDS:2, partial [Cetraspora pellucida]